MAEGYEIRTTDTWSWEEEFVDLTGLARGPIREVERR